MLPSAWGCENYFYVCKSCQEASCLLFVQKPSAIAEYIKVVSDRSLLMTGKKYIKYAGQQHNYIINVFSGHKAAMYFKAFKGTAASFRLATRTPDCKAPKHYSVSVWYRCSCTHIFIESDVTTFRDYDCLIVYDAARKIFHFSLLGIKRGRVKNQQEKSNIQWNL
jgi:hypothetical protein